MLHLAARPANQRNIPKDQYPQSRHGSLLIFSAPSRTRTCCVCDGGARGQKFGRRCGLVTAVRCHDIDHVLQGHLTVAVSEELGAPVFTAGPCTQS